MFIINIDTKKLKNMKRDQFKEKIIKLKTLIMLIKCDIFHRIHGSPILNMLICQFLIRKNITYFEYFFTVRKRQN